MKKCPFCAEQIQDEAIKCRYCGSMLEGTRDQGTSRVGLDAVQAEAAGVLRSAGKIEAIKFVREKKGLGLAEAKAYVEALGTSRNPDEAARSVPAKGGCFTVLVLMAAFVAAMAFASSRLL